jgi:hypothetical protein
MSYESRAEEPEHWHERAVEARKMAEHMHGPDARKTMLKIADGYDRVARLAVAHPL